MTENNYGATVIRDDVLFEYLDMLNAEREDLEYEMSCYFEDLARKLDDEEGDD